MFETASGLGRGFQGSARPRGDTGASQTSANCAREASGGHKATQPSNFEFGMISALCSLVRARGPFLRRLMLDVSSSFMNLIKATVTLMNHEVIKSAITLHK